MRDLGWLLVPDWEFKRRKKIAYDWYNPEIKSRRYKLTDACERMQVKVQNAHSAVGDCIMTANLVRAMETSSDSSQTNNDQEGQS